MPIYPKTNRTILERIAVGDEVSWQEFFDQYRPVVVRLGELAGVPTADCDDLVQEVMARFFKRSDKFTYQPEKAKFRTYFNTIVRGAIADYFRKRARTPQPQLAGEIPDAPDFTAFEEKFDEVWRQSVLDAALKQISQRVKSTTYLAFTMSVLENVSIAETAKFLHISPAQVYVARRRVSAMLREIVSAGDAEFLEEQ